MSPTKFLHYLLIVSGWTTVLTLVNLLIIFQGFPTPLPKDASVILMVSTISVLAGIIVSNLRKVVICCVASISLAMILTFEIFILPSALGIIPEEFTNILVTMAAFNIKKVIFPPIPLCFFGSLIGGLLGEHLLRE